MRRRFLCFPFYSLNKSNVFRLKEHCWDVNRGQTNCRYWYYSDLTRLRGKCSHLFSVSPAVRGSQSTFCAANFHVTLLSLDTHPSAKPLVFCHEGWLENGKCILETDDTRSRVERPLIRQKKKEVPLQAVTLSLSWKITRSRNSQQNRPISHLFLSTCILILFFCVYLC